jgi:hypothetical protein
MKILLKVRKKNSYNIAKIILLLITLEVLAALIKQLVNG